MRSLATATALVAALLLAGCASVPVRDVVPEQLVAEASMPGLDRIRVWGDADAEQMGAFIKAELPVLKQKYQERIAHHEPLQSNILAISGGADDGAFGAGVLAGWGETGTRPEFDLVTGISAGALVAPLVFLGADYDVELSQVFTTVEASDIFEANVLEGLFGGAAVADSGPLAKLIDKYVDEKLVRRVGEERAKGRLLIIGTTNIDAQRPVYWDMGRIAQSGDPRAIEMFRKVLLASASIPGVFPPVHFQVEAGGKTYEELHVDGGATRQLFFSPSEFSFTALDKAIGKKIERHLYVIRNGKIGPEWKATKENTLALAQRSLETLTKSQGMGDLIRAYARAKADKIDFNLVAIPNEFQAERPGAVRSEVHEAALRSRLFDGEDRGAVAQSPAWAWRAGKTGEQEGGIDPPILTRRRNARLIGGKPDQEPDESGVSRRERQEIERDQRNCVCHARYVGTADGCHQRYQKVEAGCRSGPISGGYSVDGRALGVVACGCRDRGACQLHRIEAPFGVEAHGRGGGKHVAQGRLAVARENVLEAARLAGGDEAAQAQEHGGLARAVAPGDLPVGRFSGADAVLGKWLAGEDEAVREQLQGKGELTRGDSRDVARVENRAHGDDGHDKRSFSTGLKRPRRTRSRVSRQAG